MSQPALKLFAWGHATHPHWPMAVELVLAQVRALMARPDYAAHPTLGLLYLSDHWADQAQDILDHLGHALPEVVDWAGTVGVGICANNVEYFDEPALALMLCALPSDQYRVFSGVAPLGAALYPATALVHADPRTPDLPELIAELAGRTATGFVFGGLSASRGPTVQWARSGDGTLRGQGGSSGVFQGGLSGVAFGPGVGLISRVTQGCTPIGSTHRITAAEGSLVLELDGEAALSVLLRELGVDLHQPREAIHAVRQTLVGLQEPALGQSARPLDIGRRAYFRPDVQVRHIVGLDPGRGAVAIAQGVQPGTALAFCQRSVQAARTDLVRICAEIREALEPEELSLPMASALAADDANAEPHPARAIAGAIYISCAGRGGPHFGAPSAELQIVRRALGDVPLIGFFAAGEIAYRHLYGYTGVLTVFTA
ncbi:MAG: FIST N-terminal domain-containing protein [Rhodoferax sp.]